MNLKCTRETIPDVIFVEKLLRWSRVRSASGLIFACSKASELLHVNTGHHFDADLILRVLNIIYLRQIIFVDSSFHSHPHALLQLVSIICLTGLIKPSGPLES